MELLKKYKGALMLGGLAVIALALLFVVNNPNGQASQNDEANRIDFGNGVQFDVEGGDAVIKEISSASITQPSLDRAISFEGSFIPKESQGAVRAKIEAAIALLKKDSSNLSHWIELGFYRHQAGDYRGEEEVWLYLNTVAENDIISTMNLGNLYMNFLKDYAKAEMYYRAALRIDSKNLDAYQNLYMLYKYLYKTNTSAAADVEKEALKAVPSESNYISTWAAL